MKTYKGFRVPTVYDNDPIDLLKALKAVEEGRWIWQSFKEKHFYDVRSCGYRPDCSRCLLSQVAADRNSLRLPVLKAWLRETYLPPPKRNTL